GVMAERRVLHVAIAEAGAEDHTAVGDDVERGELLGDVDGVLQGKQDDAGAERHAAGLRGHTRQSRDRLEIGERVREIVLARPYRAESPGAGEPDPLHRLTATDGLRLLRTVLNGGDQAEIHSGIFQTRPDGGTSAEVNVGR